MTLPPGTLSLSNSAHNLRRFFRWTDNHVGNSSRMHEQRGAQGSCDNSWVLMSCWIVSTLATFCCWRLKGNWFWFNVCNLGTEVLIPSKLPAWLTIKYHPHVVSLDFCRPSGLPAFQLGYLSLQWRSSGCGKLGCKILANCFMAGLKSHHARLQKKNKFENLRTGLFRWVQKEAQ